MEIEQLEIRDYLSQCPPLHRLDSAILDRVVVALEISYARKGKTILQTGAENEYLYLIRTGAVEVLDAEGGLNAQLSEGDWFGYRSILRGGLINQSVNALEDCLLYLIPGSLFLELVDEDAYVEGYFSEHKPLRLKHAINEFSVGTDNALVSTRVGELVHGTPLCLDRQVSIQQAAQMMTSATVTAMLVMEGEKLIGIVTDRAFCTKVAAKGLDLEANITTIMTPDPMTISAHAQGASALLLMARHNIRHIPVLDAGRVVGMVTATDLIRQQSNSIIYLINEIRRASSIKELSTLSQQLPATMASLVKSSMTAYDIGHAVSSIGEAITRRLLEMAEEKLGVPPVPYVWFVAGSMARNEQAAHSDQDNGLILDDSYKEDVDGLYFEQLSRFVVDGLNSCGYVYCPGEVMAINRTWRQPVNTWKNYFEQWILHPEPKALMYSSIFFDLRCVYGDRELLSGLQSFVLELTRGNSIFLAYMAANAQQHHPPLGLFRHFVLEKGGAEEKALDLKKRGVVPVIDLARVYALSAGLPALNTRERLEAAAEAGVLSSSGMADLRDAFEFIGSTRLQHQALQIENGEEPDNYVPPEQLSSLERKHLKDAFEVVATIQNAMAERYQSGAFS
jgi:CBS domain-containing protein